MSKQQRLFEEAMEQDNILRLLDEAYEQEQLDREAQQYGYGNYYTSRYDYNMYMAIEYSYLAN